MKDTLFRLLLCLGASATVTGYASGPPLTRHVCHDMFPVGHKADAQPSEPPFKIHLSQNVYTPWEELRVTVKTKFGFDMKGLFIQARRANCSHPLHHEPLGTFQLLPGEVFLKTLPCSNIVNSSISHTRNYGLKSAVFKWFAPAASIGHIYFVATIVNEWQVFWTTVYSEVLRDLTSARQAQICPARHLLDPSGPQPYLTTRTDPLVSTTPVSTAPSLRCWKWPTISFSIIITTLSMFGR